MANKKKNEVNTFIYSCTFLNIEKCTVSPTLASRSFTTNGVISFLNVVFANSLQSVQCRGQQHINYVAV